MVTISSVNSSLWRVTIMIREFQMDDTEIQAQGIGKILLNYAKDKRNKLHLNVYQKNTRAIFFYKREGFEIQCSTFDEATGEKDYVMAWRRAGLPDKSKFDGQR